MSFLRHCNLLRFPLTKVRVKLRFVKSSVIILTMCLSSSWCRNLQAREPVVWSGTWKGQVQIGSSVPAPRSETGFTFGFSSSIKLLFAANSTKHHPLDVLALYTHCTFWQFISQAYTHGKGTPEGTLSKGARMEVCRHWWSLVQHVHTQPFDLRIFMRLTCMWQVSRTGLYEQMWLDLASCLGSRCNWSPGRKWWGPWSYGQGARPCRSCWQWSLQCAAEALLVASTLLGALKRCFPAFQKTLLNSSPDGWICFLFSPSFSLFFIFIDFCFPLSIKKKKKKKKK